VGRCQWSYCWRWQIFVNRWTSDGGPHSRGSPIQANNTILPWNAYPTWWMDPCVCMPPQPFIYGDNNNTTFAMVVGTFYWSIDLFAIWLNFIFQQTHDFSEQRKNLNFAKSAIHCWLLDEQTHSLKLIGRKIGTWQILLSVTRISVTNSKRHFLVIMLFVCSSQPNEENQFFLVLDWLGSIN